MILRLHPTLLVPKDIRKFPASSWPYGHGITGASSSSGGHVPYRTRSPQVELPLPQSSVFWHRSPSCSSSLIFDLLGLSSFWLALPTRIHWVGSESVLTAFTAIITLPELRLCLDTPDTLYPGRTQECRVAFV